MANNVDCPKKDTCNCPEEDKWLQGIPAHIAAENKEYGCIRTQGNVVLEVVFRTKCFTEFKQLQKQHEGTNPPFNQRFWYGAVVDAPHGD